MDASPGNIPVFRNEPVLVLILGLVTCGLYLIYWNIKMGQVLNAVAGREVISPVVSVLSGCCMPVNIYYYYLAGQVLPDVGRLVGREEELRKLSLVLLVLGIFFPMVAAMIVQGHVNEIHDRR